jgi:prepilin-type N-terminal cleavage/methylation domain-containing protein
MKPVYNISNSTGHPGSRPALTAQRITTAGFTLVEMMIALGIFTMIIAGMVAVQIFGMRVQTLAATKLMATTDGRETLNAMRDQIRSAQQVYVGTFSNGVFTQATGLQIGNAVQLFTTTNTASTNFTIFYQDPSTNVVYSFANSSPNTMTVLAQYMTNYYCFQAEDYTQTIVSNYINNVVISVTMNFSQWEYPIGYVGGVGANAYDYYYLRTRITRRCKQ